MINLMIRKFRQLLATHKNEERLDVLRTENPDCVIMSWELHNASFGRKVKIHNSVFFNNVDIGDFSYISNNSTLYNVDIGNFCSIGPGIQIGLSPHPTRNFVSTYPAFYSDQNTGCLQSFREDKVFDDSIPKTIIGNDVWIGSNVIIPGGIEIGTGAIIAAGSVVVKDVPSYAVVGGNPAKIIKYRFSEDKIKQLISSEWWNWPIEKIIKDVDIFVSIEGFLLRNKY